MDAVNWILSHRRRLLDILGATPLLLLNLAGIAAAGGQIEGEVGGAFGPLDTTLRLALVAQIGTVLFLSQQIVLIVTRRLPHQTDWRIAPVAATLFGIAFPVLFILLPRAPQSREAAAVSAVLTVVGMAGSLWTLSYLGLSFSLLPQARGLRLGGPYGIIRHPLYLFEQVACVGIALQYQQPGALGLAAFGFLAQFPRMCFEEQILRAAYPEYSAYQRRTARLIPGLY